MQYNDLQVKSKNTILECTMGAFTTAGTAGAAPKASSPSSPRHGATGIYACAPTATSPAVMGRVEHGHIRMDQAKSIRTPASAPSPKDTQTMNHVHQSAHPTDIRTWESIHAFPHMDVADSAMTVASKVEMAFMSN